MGPSRTRNHHLQIKNCKTKSLHKHVWDPFPSRYFLFKLITIIIESFFPCYLSEWCYICFQNFVWIYLLLKTFMQKKHRLFTLLIIRCKYMVNDPLSFAQATYSFQIHKWEMPTIIHLVKRTLRDHFKLRTWYYFVFSPTNIWCLLMGLLLLEIMRFLGVCQYF